MDAVATPLAPPPVRTVTLGDLVAAVLGLRWYWLAGALVGVAAGLAAGLLMTPVYRASVTVMPVSETRQATGALPGLLARFGGGGALSLGDDGSREEALAVLRSRQFTAAFIADEALLTVLFADRWDAAAGRWREADPARIPSEWDAWQYFDREIRTVREDRDRGLVTIDIEWRDPAEAARWANLLVARVNDELRTRKLEQLARSLALLRDELERADLVELRQAIASVIQAQVNERMLASTRRDFAFRVIDPAQPPDADAPLAPKPALYAALGLSAGALLGLFAGLVRRYGRAPRG